MRSSLDWRSRILIEPGKRASGSSGTKEDPTRKEQNRSSARRVAHGFRALLAGGRT